MDSWAKATWQDVGMSFSLDEISGDIPSPPIIHSCLMLHES